MFVGETRSIKGKEYLCLDASKPAHLALLDQAFCEIYAKVFEGDEPTHNYMRAQFLKPTDGANFVFIVAGDKLSDPDRASVDNLTVSIYQPRSQTGLLAYTATREESQGQGIAKIIINLSAETVQSVARKQDRSLKSFYIECSDHEYPDLSEDPAIASQREAFYSKLGASPVLRSDVYVQGKTAPDVDLCPGLMLMRFDGFGNDTSPEVTAGFLKDSFERCSASPAGTFPQFHIMQRRLLGGVFDMAVFPAGVEHMVPDSSCDLPSYRTFGRSLNIPFACDM
jgi:hypothetical protein